MQYYDLDDLCPGMDWDTPIETGPEPQRKADLLMELITTAVRPTSWSTAGGKGSIEYHPMERSLLISQTLATHKQIRELVEALRLLMTQDEPDCPWNTLPTMVRVEPAPAPQLCPTMFPMSPPMPSNGPVPPLPPFFPCVTQPTFPGQPGPCPPSPSAFMQCAGPAQPIPGATDSHPWTLRAVAEQGKVKLQMQNDMTCMTGENLEIKVQGSGVLKLTSADKQIEVNGPHLHATADRLCGTSKPGCVCLDGHVCLKYHENGQHADVVADQVIVGLEDGHFEVKTAMQGPKKVAVGQMFLGGPAK
jgi:hypothetical protein